MRAVLVGVAVAVAAVTTVAVTIAPTPAAAVNTSCTRIGTPGPDVIYTGRHPDQVVCGVKGADLLNAGDGRHEVLRGGRGGDILNLRGCVDGCRAVCGPGVRDVAYIDPGQAARGCERVHVTGRP